MGQEKRKFKRYIFPNDENMTIKIRLSGKENGVEARLLNVSEGGLGLAINKNQLDGLEEDTEIVIESLHSNIQLQKLRELTLKVRWVIDLKPLENIVTGCEFVQLHQDGREAIRNLFP